MPSLDHPQTYKAIEIISKEFDVQLADREWHDPVDGEVVVKVAACGVCFSDTMGAAMGMLPSVPGHEITGTVVAIPDSEKTYKLGDLVGSGWHGGHCSECRSCKKGDFITCAHEEINGLTRPGGYQQYVTVRREALLALPEGTDLIKDAPLFCAGLTVFNSMRNLKARQGDTILIQGIGGLGHLAIQYAKSMGFRVVVLSTTADKEEYARKLGAHEFIVTGRGADAVDYSDKLAALPSPPQALVLTATQFPDLNPVLNSIGPDGEVLALGAPHDPVSLSLVPMIQKRLTFRAWPSGTPIDVKETLDAAQLYGVEVATEVFPYTKAKEALDRVLSGKVRFRAVLDFQQ